MYIFSIQDYHLTVWWLISSYCAALYSRITVLQCDCSTSRDRDSIIGSHGRVLKKPANCDFVPSIYRIAGNFDGGKYWCFWRFQPDRQNLTRQIFKAIQRLVKDCNHSSKYFLSNIWKASVRQNFPLYGIGPRLMQNDKQSFTWSVTHRSLPCSNIILMFAVIYCTTDGVGTMRFSYTIILNYHYNHI